MRAVIHRVKWANVKVQEKVVGEIKEGLCALIGLCNEDTEKDLEFMVDRVLNQPLFETGGESGKSLVEMGFPILCISQFTLYGKTVKGNKPDFHDSMKTEAANFMYEDFLNRLKCVYSPDKVENGVFGAMMDVSMQTDGPLTLQIDSKKIEYI